MYKLSKKETIKWPVDVPVPQDGGDTTPARFLCTFKFLEQDEIDSLTKKTSDDVEFVCGVVVDWEGVQSETGETLYCTPEHARRLANIPYVRKAMMAAFFDAVTGAKRKNS